MSAKKEVETNYIHFKDIILKLAAKSALCFECPARCYCERSPDSSGTNECEESWKKWALLPYEKA